jgi:deoxyribose-phosphate aldolase
MTVPELVSLIDHTILKPEALPGDVDRAAAEAVEHGFCCVCVAPKFVGQVSSRLRGSSVKTCAVVGFPHGTNKGTLKAIEASSTIKDGADEIDVVAHIPNLLLLDFASAKAELLEIVRAARATRRDVVIKVIVESAVLMQLGNGKSEAAIAIACQAVRESGCDFIKTSTGFHPAGGASVEAVGLMKKHGEGLQIKASGGIRDWAAAKAMLDAGADRLGLSSSVAILKEFRSTE